MIRSARRSLPAPIRATYPRSSALAIGTLITVSSAGSAVRCDLVVCLSPVPKRVVVNPPRDCTQLQSSLLHSFLDPTHTTNAQLGMLGIFLALSLGSASADGPVTNLPQTPSPPPAPPCTVEMLKQRPAGDKSWLIACSHATLGEANKELDLSGTHLSYGDFEEATFKGKGVIKLDRVGLAHADLSGSTLTAKGSYESTIDFTGANLAHADLSGSDGSSLTVDGKEATIKFTEANLAYVNLSGSEL